MNREDFTSNDLIVIGNSEWFRLEFPVYVRVMRLISKDRATAYYLIDWVDIENNKHLCGENFSHVISSQVELPFDYAIISQPYVGDSLPHEENWFLQELIEVAPKNNKL